MFGLEWHFVNITHAWENSLYKGQRRVKGISWTRQNVYGQLNYQIIFFTNFYFHGFHAKRFFLFFFLSYKNAITKRFFFSQSVAIPAFSDCLFERKWAKFRVVWGDQKMDKCFLLSSFDTETPRGLHPYQYQFPWKISNLTKPIK